MIRVCYVVDAAYAGGAERYISLLAGALDRTRFVPSLIARDAPRLDAWCAGMRRLDIEVVRIPMDMPFRPSHAGPLFDLVRRWLPDVVHVNAPGPYDGQMGLVAPVARGAGASAVIVTEHLPMAERLWKRALVKRFAYRWVDRVITICDDNVPYLTRRHRVPANRIRVVYNGIPKNYGRGVGEARREARRKYGAVEGTAMIALIGNLTARKGGDVLLGALSGIGSARWQLLIVGSGEEESRWLGEARRLGVDGRVRFLGQRPAAEIEGILAATDIVAVPSFMEGMPYVILEAMACALPVVASRVNGIPEAVCDGETGILVPPGEVEPLQAALRALIDKPAERRRLGKEGRGRFERLFTLERHVAAMQFQYEHILRG